MNLPQPFLLGTPITERHHMLRVTLRSLRGQLSVRRSTFGISCSYDPHYESSDERSQRIGYQTIFKPDYSTAADELESGLVAGAKVSWADSDEAATKELKDLGAWLKHHGLTVAVERAVAHSEAPDFEVYDPLAHPIDLAITLGGDGTVLHLASLFKEDAPMPPVVSFAMGTLGFLTPFKTSMARTVLSRLLWPPWEGEPVFATLRSRKQCEVHWGGKSQRVHRVLNECTIDRGASPQVVMLETFVDGQHVTTVHADSLIIATPSGSTAYSMSAGGPMVAPSVPCTLITPVAPHSLSFRPIVVPETAVIEVHLPESARSNSARASFDGRHTVRLRKGSSVVCRASRYALPMITMHPLDEDWYEGITAKLKWTGSLRHQPRFDDHATRG
ncbi:hypothetical protein Ndes2526B_g03744 [Nannochloris sp. 'desiccata']